MRKRKFSNGGSVGQSFKRSKPTAKDRARAASRVTTVVRAPGPIPPRSIVKMKYSHTFSSNGAAIDHMFNLNSTFDPDRTGTGHQPYGRDTYFTLYNRYRVFAVQYHVTFMSATNFTGYGMLAWDNSAALITNAELWQETPKTMTKIYTATSPAVFSGHLRLPNIVGVTSTAYKGDERYQAVGGSDPSEFIILHVGMANLDNTAVSSGAVTARVQLTYHVEWFDQFSLGQS